MRTGILATVADPDMIQEGDSGELLAIGYCAKTPMTSKYLVVVPRGQPGGWLHPDGLSHEPTRAVEGCPMEALILEKQKDIDWQYDEDADVLYLSIGTPRQAVGIDIGEGVIVRMDEPNKEVVGITVVGLRSRLLKNLTNDQVRPSD